MGAITRSWLLQAAADDHSLPLAELIFQDGNTGILLLTDTLLFHIIAGNLSPPVSDTKIVQSNVDKPCSPSISTASGHFLLSFPLTVMLQTDSLKNQQKIFSAQRHGAVLIGSFRDLKGPLFQSFVIEGKTIAFPLQEFNMGAWTVDEYKHIARRDVVVHAQQHQFAVSVKSFAHIRKALMEKMPALDRKVQHLSRRSGSDTPGTGW
jgi:hypothetical protein